MIDKIEKECLKEPHQESCGLIVFINKRTRLVPCHNWAENKLNNFKIESKDYVNTLKKGEIFGIYHSHVNSDAELSEKDIIHCEEIGIPYFVYSLKTKEHNIFIPKEAKGTKSFNNFLKRMRKNFSVRDNRE